ncbi:S1C family serine protease [Rhizobium sp. C1]|uniref:S1C family serine protease n=1 Tax=Rhizobium sp. C1 TaxID=1349799 RepID=UPI001E2B664D|nr:serine protease [Rhizobium sp. C1]MCD2177328.1 serine protease [Rhizobium sp. C1]
MAVAKTLLIFASILSFFYTTAAQGQQFKAPPGQHWIFVASAQEKPNAIGIARLYGDEARVVMTKSGWYGVVLTPRSGSLTDVGKAYPWPSIPSDAFYSNGASITQVVWTPSSPVLATAELTTLKPVSVSSGSFLVTVKRISSGEGWKARLVGSDSGRQLFELTYDFSDTSNFSSSVTLVHLNKNNSLPDVFFDANTGGAHCCMKSVLLTPDGSGKWQFIDLGEYDGGGLYFEDPDQDGVANALHRDDRFLYQFSSYAESFAPLIVKEFDGVKLQDVSLKGEFRERILEEQRGFEFLAKMTSSLWSSNGFLAAWIADAVRTREGEQAWQKMLGLYQNDNGFGVRVCPGNRPGNECDYANQTTLPFPLGLLRHLQENGYFGKQQVDVSTQASNTPAATPATVTAPAEKQKQESYSGTGFFVLPDAVLTNAHVVQGCTEVSTFVKGIEVKGKVAARDSANDLALVKIAASSSNVAKLRSDVKLGEDIAAFGFPLKGLLASSGNFTRGSVTALAGMQDDSRYLQISSPVQPGNSGGPLLDQFGNVVGVVVSKLNALKLAAVTDDIAQNINFAIKASLAASSLLSNGVQPNMNASTEKLAPADLATRATDVAVSLECTPQ